MTGHGDTVRAEARTVLRDGRAVTVREGIAADEPLVRSFLHGLCLDARRLRFFTVAADLDRMAGAFTASAGDRISMVATAADGRIVGHALCVEIAPGRAEVAVEVADELHRQGLGTILLEEVAEAAEARGIATFVAVVLPENRDMLDVFRDGFDAHLDSLLTEDIVEFPTSAWRGARLRFGGPVASAPREAQRSPSSNPRSSA